MTLGHCQGMIRLAGQADVKALATDIEPWAGLLFWQDGTLDGNGRGNNPVAMIDIQGNGGMYIGGTIYAPKALVKILGNGTSEADVAAVQVLAWQFQIGGNGILNMPVRPRPVLRHPGDRTEGTGGVGVLQADAIRRPKAPRASMPTQPVHRSGPWDPPGPGGVQARPHRGDPSRGGPAGHQSADPTRGAMS